MLRVTAWLVVGILDKLFFLCVVNGWVMVVVDVEEFSRGGGFFEWEKKIFAHDAINRCCWPPDSDETPGYAERWPIRGAVVHPVVLFSS